MKIIIYLRFIDLCLINWWKPINQHIFNFIFLLYKWRLRISHVQKSLLNFVNPSGTNHNLVNLSDKEYIELHTFMTKPLKSYSMFYRYLQPSDTV